MDCSLPGSSVYGIFQARGLEWGAIAFSHNSLEIIIIIDDIFENLPHLIVLGSLHEYFIFTNNYEIGTIIPTINSMDEKTKLQRVSVTCPRLPCWQVVGNHWRTVELSRHRRKDSFLLQEGTWKELSHLCTARKQSILHPAYGHAKTWEHWRLHRIKCTKKKTRWDILRHGVVAFIRGSILSISPGGSDKAYICSPALGQI